MAIVAGETKSVVGLRDLYIATVTTDTVATYAAGATSQLAPVVTATNKPKSGTKTQYADDSAYDVFFSEGETVIELEVTNIPLSTLATLLGKYYDGTNFFMADNTGTPPDMALGFRSAKSNGKYRYFWYLKGKFSVPDEEYSTMADSPDPKTIKLTFTAVKTVHPFTHGADGTKRIVGDEDIAKFNYDGTTWFAAVLNPDTVTGKA
jgi:phi13 family phage major tail protein